MFVVWVVVVFAYRLCVLIGGCWFLVWRFGICGWVVSLLLIGANYFGQIGGWLVLGFRWLIAGVVFGLLGVFGLGVFVTHWCWVWLVWVCVAYF